VIVLRLLKSEDEFSLNYLYSHQIESLEQLKNIKVKRSGKLLRLFIYIYKSLMLSSRQGKEDSIEVLIFSGTDNQFYSLVPLVNELSKNNSVRFRHYLEQNFFEKLSRRERPTQGSRLGHRFSDALYAIMISLIRQFYLIKNRPRFHSSLFINYYDKLLWGHLYLRRFLRLLEDTAPRIVVMSNDHNLINRCLRLVAYYKKTPTAYLQHASVSTLFPALSFDHSFLDGMVALETYLECEKNKTTDSEPKLRNIYLTGQKKDVFVENRTPRYVGIAINTLDELSEVLEFIELLTSKGIDVKVRTHPAQKYDFVEYLNNYSLKNTRVSICRSSSESLKEFFSCCHYLISGNSSIHLEAALAGLMTYYYEFSTNVQLRDYYGYVKRGLSLPWPSDFNDMSLGDLLNLSNVPAERALALKSYSETHGTRWEGREGRLVSETISRILSQQELDDLYDEDHSEVGRGFRIYRLK
jgi:hypothetical protein